MNLTKLKLFVLAFSISLTSVTAAPKKQIESVTITKNFSSSNPDGSKQEYSLVYDKKGRLKAVAGFFSGAITNITYKKDAIEFQVGDFNTTYLLNKGRIVKEIDSLNEQTLILKYNNKNQVIYYGLPDDYAIEDGGSAGIDIVWDNDNIIKLKAEDMDVTINYSSLENVNGISLFPFHSNDYSPTFLMNRYAGKAPKNLPKEIIMDDKTLLISYKLTKEGYITEILVTSDEYDPVIAYLN